MPFDHQYYNRVYGSYNSNVPPETHFLNFGMAQGFKPRQNFDPLVYSLLHPEIRPESAYVHSLMRKDKENYLLRHAQQRLPAELLDYASTPIVGSGKKLKEIGAFVEPVPVDAKEMGEAYQTPVDGTPETARFWIGAPSSKDFLELIEQRKPFCHIKLPHGFWDRMVWINNLSEQLKKLPETDLFSDGQIRLLATRLLGDLQPDVRKQLFLSDAFVQDLLQILERVQNEQNVFLGMALTGYPTKSGIANDVRSFFKLGDERAYALRTAFPDGYKFWDGTLLKRMAICGALKQLPKLIKNRHTLFIMSDRFGGLGSDWALLHSEHLVIPRENSHAIRHEILHEATKRLDEMCQKEQSPIVLVQAGGALTFWLLSCLQREFPQATLIDVGQSIDIWRVNSNVAKRPWFRVNKLAILANNPDIDLNIQDL